MFDNLINSIESQIKYNWQQYDNQPLKFIQERLNINPTPDQIKVIQSILTHPRTVVESGNGVGKSIIASAIVSYWMSQPDNDVKCISFAPTHQQVNNVLWAYIRTYGRPLQTGNILDTPQWKFGKDQPEKFAIGVSPKKGSEGDTTGAWGYHSPKLLVVLDECSGLDRMIWNAVDRLQPTRVLAIGNPIEQSGPFWEARNSKRWHSITISCLNHPNVVKGEDIIPGAVTRDWVEGMIDEHCQRCEPNEPGSFYVEWWDNGDGTLGAWFIPDARFQSMVLGIAPTESPDQLISLAWVNQSKLIEFNGGERSISLDPARRGGDRFAIVVMEGKQVIFQDARVPILADPTQEIVGWFLGLADQYGCTKGIIDETGLGGPVLDIIRTQANFQVLGVNSSYRSPEPNKYHNMRAFCWWNMRLAFQKGEIGLINDRSDLSEKLESDLIVPKYHYGYKGQLQIEEKSEIRKRLGRSPDLGDALSLHFSISRDGGGIYNRVTDQNENSLTSNSKWHMVKRNSTKSNRWRR